jgi:hypothetical protein
MTSNDQHYTPGIPEVAVDSLGSLSIDQRRRLRRQVTAIGLRQLRLRRVPIPLWQFAVYLAVQSGVRILPDIDRLSDAVKQLIWSGGGGRLRVIATSAPGVGYVFDRDDPETWPLVAM